MFQPVYTPEPLRKDADITPKKMVGSDRLSPVCFGRGGGGGGEECKQIKYVEKNKLVGELV